MSYSWDFGQRIDVHVQGQGCPECSISGFSKIKPAILYYLRITTQSSGVLYKIGVTNNTIDQRFNLKDLSIIEVLNTSDYIVGEGAYTEEQRILREFKKYRYTGPKILVSNGNTELFTRDVLELGKGIINEM